MFKEADDVIFPTVLSTCPRKSTREASNGRNEECSIAALNIPDRQPKCLLGGLIGKYPMCGCDEKAMHLQLARNTIVVKKTSGQMNAIRLGLAWQTTTSKSSQNYNHNFYLPGAVRQCSVLSTSDSFCTNIDTSYIS